MYGFWNPTFYNMANHYIRFIYAFPSKQFTRHLMNCFNKCWMGYSHFVILAEHWHDTIILIVVEIFKFSVYIYNSQILHQP